MNNTISAIKKMKLTTTIAKITYIIFQFRDNLLYSRAVQRLRACSFIGVNLQNAQHLITLCVLRCMLDLTDPTG